jgi:predicted O-methyltransferase YrrM
VVATLESITETRIVWRDGLMNPGGPHRRLRGMISPISIGEDECNVFRRLIEAVRPRHAFLIGNAFGFSSAYIAHMMEANGGESVVTLDSQTEGDGLRCARIAQQLADELRLSILTSKQGTSPQDVSTAVLADDHDLVFIDGLHAHPQVTQDFEAILPFTRPEAIFVWHDYWVPGVPQGVEAARARGVRALYLPTSCEMVLGTRDEMVFNRLRAVYPEAREELPAYGRLTPLRVYTQIAAAYFVDQMRVVMAR